MKYDIIATGSKGNCLLIHDGQFLVDLGVPYRVLRGYLGAFKNTPPAVFLTHRHRDHFNSVTARALLMDHPATVLVTPEKMKEYVVTSIGERFLRNIYTVESGYTYIAGNDKCTLEFFAQETFHDVPNVCWHICITDKATGNDTRIFYATDTGHLEGISARNYDYYFIEGNHTIAELEERAQKKLEAGEYSYEIRAARNHLSVEQAMDFIAVNAGPESKYVLMHKHVD